MIQIYLVLAERIRSEVANLDKLVIRAERAVGASRQHPEDQELLSFADFLEQIGQD